MGFSAAGFFGQINADITDQKQYIRARVDEDRTYLRQQGLQRQAAIQEQRSAYEEAAQGLITRGADERTVMGTLEMDPAGLMVYYDAVRRDTTISADGVRDMLSIAEDYRSEATMDEILATILPTVSAMPEGTDPVTSRRRTLGAWLGLDLDEELSNEVYSQQIVGGMTGDQILAGIGQPIRARGSNVGGASFDFSSTTPMSGADATSFIKTALEEYNLGAMDEELQNQMTIDGVLVTGNALETINRKRAAIAAASQLSGAARLTAILGLEDVSPMPTTTWLAGQYPNLFSPEYGFGAGFLDTYFGDPTETDGGPGTESTPEALGDPAVDAEPPTRATTGTPGVAEEDGSVIRPQMRPQTADITVETQVEADEALAQAIESNPGVTALTVKIGDADPILVNVEEVPTLTIEEREDRLNLIDIYFGPEISPRVKDETLAAYAEKYGRQEANAVVRIAGQSMDAAAQEEYAATQAAERTAMIADRRAAGVALPGDPVIQTGETVGEGPYWNSQNRLPSTPQTIGGHIAEGASMTGDDLRTLGSQIAEGASMTGDDLRTLGIQIAEGASMTGDDVVSVLGHIAEGAKLTGDDLRTVFGHIAEGASMTVQDIKSFFGIATAVGLAEELGLPAETTPSVPTTEEEAVERDADEGILYEAVNREGIDQAELEAIMKDFIEKHGLGAARDVIGREVN
jgi:hypothetical protein